MTICWATRLRGFLRHLSGKLNGVEFVESKRYYESVSLIGKLKSLLIRSPILDPLGLFQIVRIETGECDAYGSFNRLLKADKPYFLYLENPTALYHYSLTRLRFPAGKRRFFRAISDPNLRYIACMSNVCRETFTSLNGALPDSVRIGTAYPLIPRNFCVDERRIIEKCRGETVECLFSAQGRRFLTKGGLDVLRAVSELQREDYPIHLTVITQMSELDRRTKRLLSQYKDVTLLDFSLSYHEMEAIYAQTAILLHPSSDDSFGLTVLEGMKGGCAVIATKLYAFSEMVSDLESGILIEPKFRIYDENGLPNPSVWRHGKKLRSARRRDDSFVRRIKDALSELCTNRELLSKYALRGYEIAETKFGEEAVLNQWNEVFSSVR